MITDSVPRKAQYAITTIMGSIPYIVNDTQPFLDKPRIVFLDDFFYKDSYYHKGGTMPLQKFIASSTEIYLATKNNKPALLSSKRGNFRVSSDVYAEVLERMKVSAHQDYLTGKLTVDFATLNEPVDLDDFVQKVKEGHRLFGTGWVNRLTEAHCLLALEDGKLSSQSVNATEHEYVKYMASIKEMNALTFISEHNYRILDSYFKGL